MYKILGKITI
jgi:hypothetical protein